MHPARSRPRPSRPAPAAAPPRWAAAGHGRHLFGSAVQLRCSGICWSGLDSRIPPGGCSRRLLDSRPRHRQGASASWWSARTDGRDHAPRRGRCHRLGGAPPLHRHVMHSASVRRPPARSARGQPAPATRPPGSRGHRPPPAGAIEGPSAEAQRRALPPRRAKMTMRTAWASAGVHIGIPQVDLPASPETQSMCSAG